MRRLILMRHAKSSWADPGQRDFDRPLNARGVRSAPLLGAWLRERGHVPDAALVSTARRTRETWAGLGLDDVPDDNLFNARIEAQAVIKRFHGNLSALQPRLPGGWAVTDDIPAIVHAGNEKKWQDAHLGKTTAGDLIDQVG